MLAKTLTILCSLAIALPGVAAAQLLDRPSEGPARDDDLTSGRSETGGSYGDQNRGGSRGFYAFPRHRSVEGSGTPLAERSVARTDPGIAANSRNTHGSAYYGRDYGAPYFDGGYYDRGTYYRERRD